MSHRFKGFWVNSLKYNWPAYVIILLVFALGLTAGTLGVYKLQAGELQELSLYLDCFLEQAALIETEPAAAMKSELYNDLILLAAIYFLGLTIIGIPVILILVFLRGFVLDSPSFFWGGKKKHPGNNPFLRGNPASKYYFPAGATAGRRGLPVLCPAPGQAVFQLQGCNLAQFSHLQWIHGLFKPHGPFSRAGGSIPDTFSGQACRQFYVLGQE